MFTQFTFVLNSDSDFSLTLIESPAAVPSGFNHHIMLRPCQQLVCDWEVSNGLVPQESFQNQMSSKLMIVSDHIDSIEQTSAFTCPNCRSRSGKDCWTAPSASIDSIGRSSLMLSAICSNNLKIQRR